MERVGSFLTGLVRVSTLLCWRADTSSPLMLGDAAWRRRGGPGEPLRLGVSQAVDVAELKTAAKRHGATINDLLLAATGMGIRRYLQSGREVRDA